jgi:exonuclease SbcC
VRLHALTLRNFRQHVDTRITFAAGLTGIIGANGAGKTTILEAIAWALYGNSAARGTRESIRYARASDSAPVRVELEFELGAHRYRVERTLRTAEVRLDGGAEPIAKTIRGVNELLQRKLGMSRAEFFNTYFTGQKELDVMAALGPVERARFLVRVLGYDRLGVAQEMLREQRRTLIAELAGLRSGMPDRDQVDQRVIDADLALASARDQGELASAAATEAAMQLEKVAPAWQQAERSRERWVALEADRRVLVEQTEAQARDLSRLQRELASAREAREACEPLRREAAVLPELRAQLQSLDALAASESERRVIAERLRALRDDEARLDERLAKLQSAPQLEIEQRGALDALRATLAAAGRAHDEARTTWARDRQEAETRLDALRLQQDELGLQQKALEGLGEESPCPTCSRPLGASYRDVLALVTEQLDTVTVDANYFRQRVRQLASVPESVSELDTRRAAIQQEIAAAERRYARIQAAVVERDQLTPQLQTLRDRISDITAQLATYSSAYDAALHAKVRADVARVQDIAARAAQLQVSADREPAVREQLDQTDVAQRAAQLRMHTINEERALLQFDATRHEQLRSAHAEATRRVHEAELHQSECRGAVQRAEQQRDSAYAARKSLEQLMIRAAALENERSLHDELDDEYAALREELNDQLRPELSELASAFLESLTDGRYAALELDENYAVQVLEDGLPKTVLSGGEEDLCNLVLRLAISQMIAERAGQPFSLLILDEVFGSLDESRRENVLALLRRLHDRFEQVMVITHIEDVREGLDRVLSVTYDQESGSSRVQASLGGAAGAEAAAWETEGAELRERSAMGEVSL